MNYILPIITALLLAANITTPLHAAARAYQPLRQAYMRSAQTMPTLTPATRSSLGTATLRTQPYTVGSQVCRMSTTAGTISDINIAPYLTRLQRLRVHPAAHGYQPAIYESEPVLGFRQTDSANIAGWNELIEQTWQKSPREYLKLFSPSNAHPHIRLWQAIMLKDLATRVTTTPEKFPLLLNALLTDPNIKNMYTDALYSDVGSIIFTAALDHKEIARKRISSASKTSLHELLMNKAGSKLVANIMTPEFATHIAEQIEQDPDFIKYGRSSFFNIASEVLKADPTASNDLVQSIGKTFDQAVPFSIATALQIVKQHPETIKTLYPYVKSNFTHLLTRADIWNRMVMFNQEMKDTLGEENRALELINTMLKTVPEAQHDFYTIIANNGGLINYGDRLHLESSDAKALLANIQKGERPRKAKDAFRTGLGLATAGGIGYGLYKAYGEEEQAGSRVQE